MLSLLNTFAFAARRRRWSSVKRSRRPPTCSRRTRFSSFRYSIASCWDRLTQPARVTTSNCQRWGCMGRILAALGATVCLAPAVSQISVHARHSDVSRVLAQYALLQSLPARLLTAATKKATAPSFPRISTVIGLPCGSPPFASHTTVPVSVPSWIVPWKVAAASLGCGESRSAWSSPSMPRHPSRVRPPRPLQRRRRRTSSERSSPTEVQLCNVRCSRRPATHY